MGWTDYWFGKPFHEVSEGEGEKVYNGFWQRIRATIADRRVRLVFGLFLVIFALGALMVYSNAEKEREVRQAVAPYEGAAKAYQKMMWENAKAVCLFATNGAFDGAIVQNITLERNLARWEVLCFNSKNATLRLPDGTALSNFTVYLNTTLNQADG